MKIAVLCGSVSLAFPTIQSLLKEDQLAAVGVSVKHESEIKPRLVQLGVVPQNIYSFDKNELENEVKQMLEKVKPDVVWTLTFSWKIPKSVLDIPTYGFVNFHFGLLPKYAGADPVFWQIKNAEKFGGISIHKMTEEIDQGPIYLMEKIQIVTGENHGLHCQKLGMFAETLKHKLIELIKEDKPTLQDSSNRNEFFHKPVLKDLSIDWENSSATEIENLINACNPAYGGAVTSIGGMEVKLLEVSPADLTEKVEALPGQIIHGDVTYGLIVACKGEEYIRINVARIIPGYVSGVRLFNLGFFAGHRFI